MDKKDEIKSNSCKSAGNSGGSSGLPDPGSILDAASLFAYWGRDPGNATTTNPIFNSQFNAAAAAGLGLLSNTGTPGSVMSNTGQHQNTMAAAASQAASLAGLHPASWWSMAQLAAQDYFNRLQASGLPPFPHPDLSSAFNSAALGLGTSGVLLNNSNNTNNSNQSVSKSGLNSNGSNVPSSKLNKGRKDKRQQQQQQSLLTNVNPVASSTGVHCYVNTQPTVTQSNMGAGNHGTGNSSYKGTNPGYSKNVTSVNPNTNSSVYDPIALHKELMAMQAAAVAATSSNSGNSSKKYSQQSSQHLQSSSKPMPMNTNANMLNFNSGNPSTNNSSIGNHVVSSSNKTNLGGINLNTSNVSNERKK